MYMYNVLYAHVGITTCNCVVIMGHCVCCMDCVCTDNENRVKLKAMNGRNDCQEDYINASYVDVSNALMTFVHIHMHVYIHYTYTYI